ncbi:MAG: hypothetical protein GY851_26215 [bacterium]|nr:hypothetical protein [bacterium]
MEQIFLSEAVPGQILSEPVANQGGAVLCPKGTPLTEALIDRLIENGIEVVQVEGGEADVAARAKRLADLDRRFSEVDDPVMLQIKAAIEQRIATP